MKTSNPTPWRIWRKALRFFLDDAPKFLIIFPLLFIPVYVDTLLTVLIVQHRRVGRISMIQGLFIALANTPKVFIAKFRFELLGALWSFIPVLGWYKSFRNRIHWAMVSNVVIHEELSGELAIERCRELTALAPPVHAFRTMITIPALIEIVLYVGILLGTVLSKGPTIFGLCIFGLLWTSLPWSAAVNTFYYFTIPQEEFDSTLSLRINTSYKDFCPICVHLAVEGQMCRRLQINVARYPLHFSKYCASKYYEPREAV
jgi:hypothetical protein